MAKTAKLLRTHYKFKRRPNAALGELEIGTVVCGIQIPHCTIELSASDFAHPRVQAWINETIIPHLAHGASIVIVVSTPSINILRGVDQV
jgi:hypothetical protein